MNAKIILFRKKMLEFFWGEGRMKVRNHKGENDVEIQRKGLNRAFIVLAVVLWLLGLIHGALRC